MATKNNRFVSIAIVAFAVVAIVCSCSVTLYIQHHNTNSSIHTENPMTNSADSASIDIQIPK